MSDLTLYIANKNYSSWSLRPWIAMRVAGIDFDERLIPFNDDAANPEFRAFSPTGKVPTLVHGDLTVWESLAIIEYVHDLEPQRGVWPADRKARARARAVSAEMHAGFAALRSACPMNMRRPRAPVAGSAALDGDVERLRIMWSECLQRSGGPFLFGSFSGADAMYAPVVNRLDVYALTEDATMLAYMDAVKALPAWRDWEAAGRAEPWVVPADEA